MNGTSWCGEVDTDDSSEVVGVSGGIFVRVSLWKSAKSLLLDDVAIDVAVVLIVPALQAAPLVALDGVSNKLERLVVVRVGAAGALRSDQEVKEKEVSSERFSSLTTVVPASLSIRGMTGKLLWLALLLLLPRESLVGFSSEPVIKRNIEGPVPVLFRPSCRCDPEVDSVATVVGDVKN